MVEQSIPRQQRVLRNRRQILRTIFKANLAPSVTLLLVEYTDGSFAVTRNGNPISARTWDASDLEECVNVFQKLCRQPQEARAAAPQAATGMSHFIAPSRPGRVGSA